MERRAGFARLSKPCRPLLNLKLNTTPINLSHINYTIILTSGKDSMATAEALRNNKAWVMSGYGVSSITLVIVDTGEVLYHSPIPWLCGSTADGAKMDIVGCRNLSRARVVDDLKQVKGYKIFQPILLRHRNDMSDIDDRRGMWIDYNLYLPIESWRCVWTAHDGECDEFLLTIPGIAEPASVYEPERFEVDEFYVKRLAAVR